MAVQYMFNEKGKKTAAVVPIKEWEAILKDLKSSNKDFWNELPDHVKQGIERGQQQAALGKIKSHSDVMHKYKKYL
jgi:hypothetical protein